MVFFGGTQPYILNTQLFKSGHLSHFENVKGLVLLVIVLNCRCVQFSTEAVPVWGHVVAERADRGSESLVRLFNYQQQGGRVILQWHSS